MADDSPFVPDDVSLNEINQRWQALKQSNSAYFDGSMYHVIGVHRNGYGGATIHVKRCSYRMYAVQTESFDTGARGLGTKGITIRDGCVLMGKRSANVSRYAGQWEFAPAGVVEIGREPADVITTELREETGLLTNQEPIPIAMIYDDIARCWEIIFRISWAQGNTHATSEYPELKWCSPSEIPKDLSPPAQLMLPMAERELRNV